MIGRVRLSFDEPMMLDCYVQNPVTGGPIFIDQLNNVTAGAGMVGALSDILETPLPQGMSCFERDLNTVIRKHFPHWQAKNVQELL